MEFDILPLYYSFIGVYFCAALLLGMSLCFGLYRTENKSHVTPPMRLAGITLLLDLIPVSMHLVHRAYFPHSQVFEYLFPFTDLLISSMFILAGISLLSAKYPSAKAYAAVLISALAVYVVFVVTGSNVLFSVLTVVWIAIMFIFIVRDVKRYNKVLFFHYANVESHRSTWFAYIMVWAFAIYPIYKLCELSIGYSEHLYIVYSIAIVVLYSVLARKVYAQTYDTNHVIQSLHAFDETSQSEDRPSDAVGHSADDYFSAEQKRKMKDSLTRMMESEKLYRNSQLCVDDLVQRLGTNASYFYYFMRDVVGSSFFDYVNNYRVNEAKDMLLKGEKIEYISESVGYGTANTFRRAFKKATGLTPSEWRQSQEE